MSSGIRSKAIWTLGDQLVASSTNALLAVLVARSVDAFAFGSFALAFLVFSFVGGMVRAMVTDPLLIRHAADHPDQLRIASAQAAGASAVLGALASVGCVVVGLWVHGPTSWTMLALAVVLPGLLVQDAWRRAFFAANRPASAFVNDTIWSLLQLGAVVLMIRSGSPGVAALLLAWGLSGLVAAGVGVHQIGYFPMPVRGMRWFWHQRSIGLRLGLDFLVSQGAFSIAMVVISATASVAVVGSLRAGQVLLAPVQVLLLALTSFALPMLVRLTTDLSRFRQLLRILAAGAAGCTLLWVVPLAVLPDSIGGKLMGASWAGAKDVLPLLGLQMLLIAVATGPALALKALGQASTLLRVSLVQAPILLVASVAGGALWGGPGAAAGLVVAHAVGTVLVWRSVRAAVKLDSAAPATPTHRAALPVVSEQPLGP